MQTIYVDMDDVVADFSGLALQIAGYLMPDSGKEKYPESVWKKFVERCRLYNELEKCPGADEIVATASSIAGVNGWSVKFLTAIPRDNDFPWAFYDKCLWAQRYYPGIPVWFGPYSLDKHLRCRPGDILIDDRYRNCQMWTSMGGLAIHHTSAESTIEKLKELQ